MHLCAAGQQPGDQRLLHRGGIGAIIMTDDKALWHAAVGEQRRQSEADGIESHQIDFVGEAPARIVLTKAGRLDEGETRRPARSYSWRIRTPLRISARPSRPRNVIPSSEVASRPGSLIIASTSRIVMSPMLTLSSRTRAILAVPLAVLTLCVNSLARTNTPARSASS